MDEDLKPRYSTKRLRQEIERARNNDAQTITALEAQLAYWQSQHDERTRQLGAEATPPTPKVTDKMVYAFIESVSRMVSNRGGLVKISNRNLVSIDGAFVPVAVLRAALTAAQESGE